MLVLTRKGGEQIVIGKEVVISVLRVAGNRVRIGIEAPESVQILRGELELCLDASAFLSTCERLELEP